MESPILLARRPVLDADGRVRGQRLRFGGAGAPPEQGTASLLGGATGALARLTGGVPAWIATTPAFLETFDPLPAEPGSVVCELPAATPVDDALLARLRRLRAEGHRLALTGYLPGLETDPLVALADVVEVDLRLVGVAGLGAVLSRLPYEHPVVLAAGVASPAQRDACVARGVTLLDGPFLAQSRRVDARTAPVGSVPRLRTLVALRERPGFEELEAVVGADPGLTLRLLGFANSASSASRRRFGSVREALVHVGAERTRQFLLLALLSELGEARPALVGAAILRARLCEVMAGDLEMAEPGVAFTAGLLSVVDAMLDRKMVDVLKDLPVTEELRWALVARVGPLGALLETAVRLELARPTAAELPGLADALAWSDEVLRDAGGS